MSLIYKKSPYKVPASVLKTIDDLVSFISTAPPVHKRNEKGEILMLFNNLTEDNYEATYSKIVSNIETPSLVATLFFDRVNLKYATGVYAAFYLRVMKLHPEFEAELERRLLIHLEALEKIVCTPPADYDELCAQKDQMDRLMSFTKFLLSLKVGVERLYLTLKRLISENKGRKSELDVWVAHVVLLPVEPEFAEELCRFTTEVSIRTTFIIQDAFKCPN